MTMTKKKNMTVRCAHLRKNVLFFLEFSSIVLFVISRPIYWYPRHLRSVYVPSFDETLERPRSYSSTFDDDDDNNEENLGEMTTNILVH